MLNEDICRISFKRFNGGPEQVYPTISICIFNPILEHELNRFVTISTPKQLLHERYLQEVLLGTELRNVTFDEITLDINQNLLDYDILLLNQSQGSYKDIKDVKPDRNSLIHVLQLSKVELIKHGLVVHNTMKSLK